MNHHLSLKFNISSFIHILTLHGMPEAILNDMAYEVKYSKLTNSFFLKYGLQKYLFLNLYTYKHTSLRRKLIEHGQVWGFFCLFVCLFFNFSSVFCFLDPVDPHISNSNMSSLCFSATIHTCPNTGQPYF